MCDTCWGKQRGFKALFEIKFDTEAIKIDKMAQVTRHFKYEFYNLPGDFCFPLTPRPCHKYQVLVYSVSYLLSY